MINRFQRDKSTLRGGVFVRRRAAASYRRVIGVFSVVSRACRAELRYEKGGGGEGDGGKGVRWHAGGRGGGSNDLWWGEGSGGGALGRCIVGVLAFNLTVQFH
jgi:hypothetical protein